MMSKLGLETRDQRLKYGPQTRSISPHPDREFPQDPEKNPPGLIRLQTYRWT